MYVHLGGEVSVPSDTIIGLLDLETVVSSQKKVNEFIESEDDRNKLQYLSGDIPKTLVITDDRTYVSPMSVSVLGKRLEGNA